MDKSKHTCFTKVRFYYTSKVCSPIYENMLLTFVCMLSEMQLLQTFILVQYYMCAV